MRYSNAVQVLILVTITLLARSPGLPAQDIDVRSMSLPEPWGEHPVGVRQAVIFDSARHVADAAGIKRPRPILLRLWYPAADPGLRPRSYMSAEVAEAWRSTLPVPTGWEAGIHANAVADAPLAETSERLPVLLFSHGRSFPVENYQILLEHLASRGWVVAAISHAGEEALTRLPDGTGFPFAGPGWENEDERSDVLMGVVDDLVGDARLALDWLASAASASRGPFAGRLDVAGGVGYIGHSLGGAAAVWTMQRDARVIAAASWEGQVYRTEDRPLTPSGPVMYLIGGANRAELAGRHFRAAGPDRPVYEVVIHGAWHASVGDLLFVYRRYAPRDWLERHRREITAARANQITGDYLHAFFARHLLGRKADLLEPDMPGDDVSLWNYPEVELRVHLGRGGYWSSETASR